MPKGLVFIGGQNINYGYVSNAKIYTDAILAATGIKMVDLPDTASGVTVPWRLPDLLQAGELRRVNVVLNDGAGKRTNRTLYITKDSVSEFRKTSANGGLIGATIDGKVVLSASMPRKASFALM